MNARNFPERIATLACCTVALLPGLGAIAQAQEKNAPAPAAGEAPAPATVPAQTDMQKWLFDLDAQWQATFKRDVTDVREAELDKLKLQYLNWIEAAVSKTSKAGDLDVAVALRNEQKRFSGNNEVPAQDDAGDVPLLKQIRAGWRTRMAAIEASRRARAKATHARYEQILSQAQTRLTQHERLDDALLVKARRDEVAAAWLAGIPAAPAPVAVPEKPKPQVPPPVPKVAATPAAESAGGNLLKNGNFETGTDGWKLVAEKKNAEMAIDTNELRNGKPTLRIDTGAGDLIFVTQTAQVKPNTRYVLAGYIKTKGEEPVKKGEKQGACLMVSRGGSTPPMQMTKGWTRVSVELDSTEKTGIEVGPGMGRYSTHVTGTAWFAELSLTELAPKGKK